MSSPRVEQAEAATVAIVALLLAIYGLLSLAYDIGHWLT